MMYEEMYDSWKARENLVGASDFQSALYGKKYTIPMS